MNEGRQPQRPEQALCANCGAELELGSNFCPTCGALTSGSPAQPAPLAIETTPRPEYMGFWIRLLAWIVDVALIALVNLLLARAGLNLLTFFVGPVYAVLFIGLTGQTLGKLALGIKVIDAEGNVPGLWRAILREIVGKFISGLALGLGYVWISWDSHKRGWHDHIAGTYVVRKERERPLW
jgi:uncharacterized RDD family membrane protein YckC